MKSSRKKLLVALGVVGILVGGLIVWMGKDTRTLADGSRLKLMEVQCNSPISFTEYPSGWLLGNLPKPIQRVLKGPNSNWEKSVISLSTESNAMHVLLMQYIPNHPPSQNSPDSSTLFARLADGKGNETEKASLVSVTPNARRVPLVCAFFPDHSLGTNLTLRIYDTLGATGEIKVAEFPIKNVWPKK